MPNEEPNINSRLIRALVQIVLIFSIGTFGFNYLLKDITLLEALYLTVMTLTTVGYGDISPLKDANLDDRTYALIFAIFLMIFGMSSFVYAAGILTQYVTSGQLRKNQRLKNMQNSIQKFNHHFIIIGASETGCYIADELNLLKRRYVLIDTSQKILDDYTERNPFVHYIRGDATDEDTLIRAGLARAKRVAITLPSPKDTLFLIMTLKELATKHHWNFEIVSKCPDDIFEKKFRLAGVDHIIKSDKSCSEQIVTELYRPASKTFIDRLSSDSLTVVRIDEVTIQEKSALDNVLLQNSKIKEKTGLRICAVKEFINNKWHINPNGDFQLKAGDILIFVGSLQRAQRLRKMADNV